MYTRGQAPTPDTPSAWHEQSADAQIKDSLKGHWWHEFNDTTLNHLVDQALTHSPDSRLVAAGITEARAMANGTDTQLLPSIRANGNMNRIGAPSNGNTFRRGISNTYDAGFDALWELDLFGRNLQQSHAADANTQAVIAEGQSSLLSLVSEITRHYTLLRLYQTQEYLAQKNAKAQESTLEITRARVEQGVEGPLELKRAESLLKTTESQIPLYASLAQTSAYQLDYLVGDKPGTHRASLVNTDQAIPVIDRDIFLNVPLNIIQRRPDVIAAEQHVVQQTSLKKSTIAEIFPTISLSAMFGYSALNASNMFTSNSQNWMYGGAASMPLLDFGRIRAGIGTMRAREEQALIHYEQTVLNALREVETAAQAYGQAKNRFNTLNEAAQAAGKAVDIARLQYKEGILSQLDVLNAEQNAYQTDETLAQAAADLTQNFIVLCKALALMPES